MKIAAVCLLLAGCFDYRGLSAGLGDASSSVDASHSPDGAQVVDGAQTNIDLKTTTGSDLAQPPSDLSGSDLDPSCECSPGTTRMIGCGNCGTEMDTCGTDCRWAAGACTGEGVCSPGSTIANCIAMMDVRTCTGACTWGPCEIP